MPEASRFCPSCGHATVARADERRIATVVFADIVGFTSLAEALDPESVKELVDRCFERLAADVTSFGGKVDKIVGDAIVALFGAPIAHEDDPERAVRAALRMQATVAAYADEADAAVRVRIGVNTGEVLVGSLRAGGEYTAMGDVVNTAQRLQAAAEPGAVLVGPATYNATHEVIAYRHLGAVPVRGRDEAVDTWEALEPMLPPGHRPRRSGVPVVGRDVELGLFGQVVDGAVQRRRAQLVVLLGEAGVGKSRLATEMASIADQRYGARVLDGRCVPYGEANVWWPIAEAIRQACGITSEASRGDAGQAASLVVAEALGVPVLSPDVRRVIDGLLFLLGYEVPLREIDPQRAREDAQWAVLTFLEGLARQSPLALVLSDLHWADPALLSLLDVLLERLARTPFVLVATARGSIGEHWASRAGRHNSVIWHLDPLDRNAAARLLDVLIDADIPADLREALLDRAGGNPLFLEELLGLVADVDAAATEGLRQALTATGDVADLPDTLRGLVAARLDSLGRDERGVLEDAAVWGRSGRLEVLREMGSKVQHLNDIGPALAVLVDRDVLVVDGNQWSFRSDLVREVAYATLTKSDRARRHAGTAFFLDREQASLAEASDRAVDVIAHHYAVAAELRAELGAVDGLDPSVTLRALDWLEEAVRRANVANLSQVAIQLSTQAIELIGSSDAGRRARLLLSRASAHANLRELPVARDDIDDAVHLAADAGDDEAGARALLVLGDLQQKEGDLANSAATIEAAVDRFRDLGDVQGEAEGLRLLGMTHIFTGDGERAEQTIAASLDLARSLDDRRLEAWCLQHLAWISFVAGQPDEAEERLRVSAATFTELGDRGGLNWANGLLAFVNYNMGRFDEAEALGIQVLTEADERNDRWGHGMMLLLMCGVHLWSGRSIAALRNAEEALREFRDIADRFGESQSIVNYGRAMVMTGSVPEGLAVLRDGVASVLDGSVAVGGDAAKQMMITGLAAALVQVGDPEAALEALALGPGGRLDADGLAADETLVALALAQAQSGAPEQALATLGPCLAANGDEPFAYAVAAATAARAQLGAPLAELEQLAASVRDATRASYLDRALADLSVTLVRAAQQGADAIAGFDAIAEDLARTEDDVAPAVLATAQAVIRRHLGLPGEVQADAEATERWALLGVDGHGWQRLFEQIVANA